MRSISLAFVAGLLVFLAADIATAGGRVALVVGNGAYREAQPLPNPVRDAEGVAASLERLGFKVRTVLDGTQADLLAALDAFAADAAGAEAALFYYSGHGMQIDGTNFLLPVDIKVASERSIRYGAIDVGEVVADMERNAGVTLVILDACRDNPFVGKLQTASRSVAGSRGLAPIRSEGNGTLIAFSALPGAVASDGEGTNSPYTAALLAEIEKPNVEVGLVFRRVAGRVVEATGGEQHPDLLVRLTREFYLRSEAPEDAPLPAVAAAPASPPELAVPPPVSLAAPPVSPAAPAVASIEPPLPDATVPERAASRPAAAGPYGALLARLDLSAMAEAPVPPWVPADWTPAAEVEPNSSQGTANPLDLRSRLTLAIDPIGDGDWFYFAVGSAGELHVSAATPPPAINLASRILNADGQVVVDWQAAQRPGGALDFTADLPAKGTYWIEFRDGGNDAGAAEPFEASLDFIGVEDGYEPNDQPSKARTVSLDGGWRANILPRGDADWYRFVVREPGELTVRMPGSAEALDVVMRLVDADLALVKDWTGPLRPGGETLAAFPIRKPGIYLLEVRDGANDSRSAEAFSLETHFTPSVDVDEPNDTVSAAASIAPTGERRLTIFPQGDADFFRIEVDQPGELWLGASGVPEQEDIVFRVLNPDLQVVRDWVAAPRPGADNAAFIDLATAGAYLVEVRDGANDAASIEPFSFATRFTPSPDQYEPNDTAGLATELKATGEVAFNILPQGDADLFRVTVESPGELAIAIDHGPADLDLVVRVLNADLQTLVDWVPPFAKGGLTSAVADLPSAGTYFLEVRDGGNDARSIEHATLKTTFTATLAVAEPNDTYGLATPVPLSGETAAAIFPRNDADWQIFYADAPGELRISVTQAPENLDIAFRVLDGEQRDLTGWIGAPRPGADVTGAVSLDHAGWYRMEIRDGGNDARSTRPFSVARQFTAAPQ